MALASGSSSYESVGDHAYVIDAACSKIICRECKKKFCSRFSLNRHLRTYHNAKIETRSQRATLRCPMCFEIFRTNDLISSHIEEQHGFVSHLKYLSFETEEEFQSWKSNLEKEDNAKFIIRSACRSNNTTYYRCKRSGHYRSKVSPEDRKRELKEQGSCKINAHCPASIIAQVDPDGSVDVTVQRNHFGHEMKLGDAPISSPAKEAIIFYKPKGEPCSLYPQLNIEDLVLVIMTPGQKLELEKYGGNVCCLDSTNGLTAYGYPVTTLLVLNSLREEMPCAFFISNRNDQSGLEIFLQTLKGKVGDIHPKVLMTDTAHKSINAWGSVMSGFDKHLFCEWHVLQNWDEHITDRIKVKEKRDAISKELHVLMKETDIGAFNRRLRSLVGRTLDNPDTRTFGEYFRTHYTENVRKWAYCFRLGAGANVNMTLERFHEELKRVSLIDAKAKRLDITVHALMRITNREQFQRTIANEKGKLDMKMRQIRKSHRESEKMDVKITNVSDNSWMVSSSDSLEKYIVTKVDADCKCDLLCKRCKVCIHMYCCTCIDWSAYFNICKHIHLLCRYLGNFIGFEDYGSDSEGQLCPPQEPVSFEEDSTETIDNIAKSDHSFEKRKNDLLGRFMTLWGRIDTDETLAVVEEAVHSAQCAIDAANAHSVKLESPQIQVVNVTRKTEPRTKCVPECKKKKAGRANNPTLKQRRTSAAKPLLKNAFPEDMSDSDLSQPFAMEIVIDSTG